MTLSWGAERQLNGPIDIEADHLEYDEDTDTYRGVGNVVVNFKDGFLVADSVVLNRSTGDAEASGNAFVSDKGDTMEGDRISFNLNTKKGITYNGKAFLADNHVYLGGALLEKKGEQTYHAKDATMTTCDQERPDWRFTAKEMDVTVEGYGTMKEGTFQVKNVPLFYSPYMVFPAKAQRESGFLTPQLSFSSGNGLDVELPYYWVIGQDSDATFYQRYIQQRGWKEGMEFRYFQGKDTFGTFYVDYLKDSLQVPGIEDGLVRDWTGSHNRWSYYLNNQSTFASGVYLRTDLVRVSDIWYFKDFTNFNYYLDNYAPVGDAKFHRISFLADQTLATLDSTARLVKDWPLYNLTVLTKYTDNLATQTNDASLQSYPSITFTGVKQPLFGTHMNFELASSYLNAYRNEGGKGQVVDVNPTFSYPYNNGDYFQLNPSMGLRETAWQSSGGIVNNTTARELYALGLYGTTEVYRIFTVDDWGIDKVRHGIKPELTYTFIPSTNQAIPDFAPAVPSTNTLTCSVTNTLTSKSTDKTGVHYQEFLPSTVPEIKSFSPITAELDLKPSKYFTTRSVMLFDPTTTALTQNNHDLLITDDRGDSLSVGYRYTQSSLEELNLYLTAKLTKQVDFKYVQRHDMLNNQNVESTYLIDYHQQCWSAAFSWSEQPNNRAIMVVFTLFGLGKIGNVSASPASLMGKGSTQ
jgi:LPS-assembly protein